MQRSHEPLIDWLRAFASLAVVVFHLNEARPGASDPYALAASLGWLGVPVFFVVSGYCVTLSSLKRPSALSFLIKRYARVLPPYWASLAVVIAVVVFRKLFTGNNDVATLPLDPVSIFATLTLTTSPVTSTPTINWVYWTLSYELAFYGVMALALIRKELFSAAMIGLTLASLVLAFYPLAKLPGLFFLDHWALFAAGIGLAETIHNRSRAGGALLVIAIAGIFTNHPSSVEIASLVTIALIGTARQWPRVEQRLRSRTFEFLGNISYSLYLIHVPIGVYAIGHLLGITATDTIGTRIGADALLVAVCIAFAWGFNRAVERPVQQWSRTLFNKPKNASTDVAMVPLLSEANLR